MSYVEIGQIMGTHGVRGDLRVWPYNYDSPMFRKGGKVFVQQNKSFSEYEITFIAQANKGIRLHLKGIEDLDAAKKLYKIKIFCPREDFAELDEDEFYLVDMIGMKMLDHQNGRNYGTITEIMETGANDCYVVKGEEFEILVPAIEGVIQEIDKDKKQITVILPEGLLEIYES